MNCTVSYTGSVKNVIIYVVHGVITIDSRIDRSFLANQGYAVSVVRPVVNADCTLSALYPTARKCY